MRRVERVPLAVDDQRPDIFSGLNPERVLPRGQGEGGELQWLARREVRRLIRARAPHLVPANERAEDLPAARGRAAVLDEHLRAADGHGGCPFVRARATALRARAATEDDDGGEQ